MCMFLVTCPSLKVIRLGDSNGIAVVKTLPWKPVVPVKQVPDKPKIRADP